jgi:type I restriction enzyme M protein
VADQRRLDLPALEQWLWDAACSIRGAMDAPKFKDFILPLVFLKRLSDVYDGELARLAEEFGSEAKAENLAAADHNLVRFFVPSPARWSAIARTTTGLGEHLTDAVRATVRENQRLAGVIDIVDFNATTAGQRMVDDGRLTTLVQVLSRHRLSLGDVEPDILGRAYEFLLRKFAESQGQSAGEFYTPREVGVLMARILDPQPGESVYDPCCGSGGLLIKCHLRLLETHGQGGHSLPSGVAPLKLFGQELNTSTFAISKMNSVIHDMEAEISLGDTMTAPRFTESDSKLRRFDIVTANPMWNQDFPASTYEHDPYERFELGVPPSSTADWGWVQHMYQSLNDEGRMAVVLDTGAVSRGSGTAGANKERDIRKAFVDRDLVEAVVLLPGNLFYNTSSPGIVMVLNGTKPRPGEILLINASRQFTKGRPKNFLDDAHVAAVADIFAAWRSKDALSEVVTTEQVVSNDYNLSPSRYVAVDGDEEVMSLEDAVVLLKEAEEERAAADEELKRVLAELGFGLS